MVVENGFDSAVVVSSDYHMRRVKLVFDQLYENSDIELTYGSSQQSDKAWYQDS